MKNPYQVLGVSPTATDEEVKQAIATWKELHHLIDLEDDPYFSTDDGDDYYCF